MKPNQACLEEGQAEVALDAGRRALGGGRRAVDAVGCNHACASTREGVQRNNRVAAAAMGPKRVDSVAPLPHASLPHAPLPQRRLKRGNHSAG